MLQALAVLGNALCMPGIDRAAHRPGARQCYEGGSRSSTLSKLMMRRACGPLAPLLDAMTPAHAEKVDFRRESMCTRLALHARQTPPTDSFAMMCQSRSLSGQHLSVHMRVCMHCTSHCPCPSRHRNDDHVRKTSPSIRMTLTIGAPALPRPRKRDLNSLLNTIAMFVELIL